MWLVFCHFFVLELELIQDCLPFILFHTFPFVSYSGDLASALSRPASPVLFSWVRTEPQVVILWRCPSVIQSHPQLFSSLRLKSDWIQLSEQLITVTGWQLSLAWDSQNVSLKRTLLQPERDSRICETKLLACCLIWIQNILVLIYWEKILLLDIMV